MLAPADSLSDSFTYRARTREAGEGGNASGRRIRLARPCPPANYTHNQLWGRLFICQLFPACANEQLSLPRVSSWTPSPHEPSVLAGVGSAQHAPVRSDGCQDDGDLVYATQDKPRRVQYGAHLTDCSCTVAR